MITDKITIFPEDFTEIKQSEYKKLKRDDPQKANGYTARIRFRYFKLKEKAKIPLNKAISEIESEWDKLTPEHQDLLKEIVIARIKQYPPTFRMSLG